MLPTISVDWYRILHKMVSALLPQCQIHKQFAGPVPIPLPNSADISANVDVFGPRPTTARGTFYILLLFFDRFNRCVNMFTATAADFASEGPANILINRSIPLWRCSFTLLSNNGPQVFAQLATAVCKLLGIHRLTTSAEGVNYTMEQMLATRTIGTPTPC